MYTLNASCLKACSYLLNTIKPLKENRSPFWMVSVHAKRGTGKICLKHNKLSMCCFAILKTVIAFMCTAVSTRIWWLFLILRCHWKKRNLDFLRTRVSVPIKVLYLKTENLRKSSGMLHRIIRSFSRQRNDSIFNDKQSNMTVLGMFIPEDRFRNIPTFHREWSSFGTSWGKETLQH